MASKVFVNYSGAVLSAEKSKQLQERVADALGVCHEDVIVLGDVHSISVVEVPDSMTRAHKKQEAKEAKEVETKEVHKATVHEAHKGK